jgi:hypothetical protein
MGDRRIFLKTGRDAYFNKDLSNEPNFDRIHLAGQYLLNVYFLLLFRPRINYQVSIFVKILEFYLVTYITYRVTVRKCASEPGSIMRIQICLVL